MIERIGAIVCTIILALAAIITIATFCVAQISIPFPGPGMVAGGGGGFTNTRSISASDIADTLTRTQGTGDSRQKMTFSFWYRTDDVANSTTIFSSANAGIDFIAFFSSAPVVFLNSAGAGLITTTGVSFLDNTWYHIVVQLDTSNATPSERCKIFVNNSDVTSTSSPVTLNYNTNWGLNGTTEEGPNEQSGVATTLIDEFSKIDNQVLAPSSFATSNLPINIAALTFGAQGYWLRFETGIGATLGVDSSGNGLTFTSTYDDADSSTTVP